MLLLTVVLECSFNVRQSNGFHFMCDLDQFSQIQSHITMT